VLKPSEEHLFQQKCDSQKTAETDFFKGVPVRISPKKPPVTALPFPDLKKVQRRLLRHKSSNQGLVAKANLTAFPGRKHPFRMTGVGRKSRENNYIQ